MVYTLKFSQFNNINISNTTNLLAGIDSPSGGNNIIAPFTTSWTTSGRPISPYNGLMGYNTTLSTPEYWDGISWVQLFGSGGNVTQINTGTGLTGGPITTTGTISFAPIAANSLWANTADMLAVPTVTPLTTFLLSANNLSDLVDAATARINLFLSGGVGSAGQVLTSNGVSAPASWEDVTNSGFVNPGTINELAWYAANGNTISPLPTIPNGILTTNSSSAPAIATVSTVLTLLGFASSLAASGYYKLPGGLIVQWGITSLLSQGAFQTITLPIAYPTTGFVVLTSPHVSGGTGIGASSGGIFMSNTQITVTNTANTTNSAEIFWCTLGN